MMIGHNQNIGWGITIAYTDVEDIFDSKRLCGVSDQLRNECFQLEPIQ